MLFMLRGGGGRSNGESESICPTLFEEEETMSMTQLKKDMMDVLSAVSSATTFFVIFNSSSVAALPAPQATTFPHLILLMLFFGDIVGGVVGG